MTPDAPSARAIETALSIAHNMLVGLAEDQVDIDEDEVRVLLREADADVEALVARLLRAATQAEDDVESLGRRLDVIGQRRARHARRYEACRSAVLAIMQALPQLFPKNRFQHPEFTASVSVGRPRPIVTDETALPDECWRITRAPDMTAIRERLKQGPVPGVTLGNAAPVLTVRPR